MIKKHNENIKDFIIENVGNNHVDIIARTASEFGISRQAANKHINKLVEQGIIFKEGKTRNVKYFLHQTEWTKVFNIDDNSSEDIVWRNEIQHQIAGLLPSNAVGICQHGFSEMFNNAIDHSDGHNIIVTIKKSQIATIIIISDNGVGIFKKIKDSLRLLDERQSVVELTKGKLTTDPARHSGEGIFFSSRMFDEYSIFSGEVILTHLSGSDEDWIFQNTEYQSGTTVFMKLMNNTTRTINEVFNKFTDDGYGFIKTIVPVRLAQYGDEQLISRSQAKRLLVRVEKFKVVLFDFKDVEYIGQAFADEVFRVFAAHHPNIEIYPINTNENVIKMIKHVTS